MTIKEFESACAQMEIFALVNAGGKVSVSQSAAVNWAKRGIVLGVSPWVSRQGSLMYLGLLPGDGGEEVTAV